MRSAVSLTGALVLDTDDDCSRAETGIRRDVTRGVLRITGTILGLLLATVLFHFLPIHVATEIIMIGVFTFLMRWIGPANYGVFCGDDQRAGRAGC